MDLMIKEWERIVLLKSTDQGWKQSGRPFARIHDSLHSFTELLIPRSGFSTFKSTHTILKPLLCSETPDRVPSPPPEHTLKQNISPAHRHRATASGCSAPL